MFSKKSSTAQVTARQAIFLVVAWTSVCAGSLAWTLRETRERTLEAARLSATAAFERDHQYQRWAAAFGGVFVETSAEPSAGVPLAGERDVVTTDGARLTLVTPPHMTRAVYALADQASALHFHMSALRPLSAANAADAWETGVLRTLTAATGDVTALADGPDGPVLRVLKPLRMEAACLQCHGGRGYAPGDAHGAIRVDVPMEPLYRAEVGTQRVLAGGHALLWALGVTSLVFWRRRLNRALVVHERSVQRRSEDAALQMMMDDVADPILFIDAERRIRMSNPAARAFYGLAEGTSPRCFQALHGAENAEQCPPDCPLEAARHTRQPVKVTHGQRRASGDERRLEILASPVFADDRTFRGIIKVARDVTEREVAAARLDHLARHDMLTQLPNRRSFEEELTRVLAARATAPPTVGVMFIDVDRFKHINDTLGHGVGDKVLRAAADRVRSALPDGAVVARFGGDSFTVVMEANARDQVQVAAHRIMFEFARTFAVDGMELHLSASIGIAVGPEDGRDQATLLRCADSALDRAKRQGRNAVQFYTPDDESDRARRLQLEQGLHTAAQRGEIHVAYQPQVESQSGRTVAMEALVRWRHPVLGEVPPGDFIGIAEETGLIVELGRHVLREACRAAAGWNANGGRLVRVAVNLSPRQLRHRDLVADVAAALRDSGLRPNALELEITESAVMEDPVGATATFGRLKDLGVSIAVDDFGTGYSSLGYLKQFPVDVLKIDRVFVRDLPGAASDAALIQAVIALADAFGLAVVAEGVETEAQRDFLARAGCHMLQGFLFSRPLKAEAAAAWLAPATVAEVAAAG